MRTYEITLCGYRGYKRVVRRSQVEQILHIGKMNLTLGLNLKCDVMHYNICVLSLPARSVQVTESG